MSVWSEFEGSVEVKTKDRFSIRKAIEGIRYDESNLHIDFMPNSSSDDVRVYHVYCNFSLDGESAMNYFNEVLKALDKTKYDLTIKVRYIK